jgi:hypothetical protein
MLNYKIFVFLLLILINIYNVYITLDEYIIFGLSSSDSGVEILDEPIINLPSETIEEELPAPPIVPINRHNTLKTRLNREISSVKYKLKENVKFFRYSPSQFVQVKIEEVKALNPRFSF